MAENLERQPNYTCLETVERMRQDRAGKEVVRDTLRLEVAVVEGKEMFAWPGSPTFDDREVHEMIPTGMFGNGNFAIFARIVFAGNAPDFEYGGETNIDGRATVRYDFRVPRARSKYRIGVNLHEAVVGFHGSFYADRETDDIRRLEVSADEISPDLGVLASEDRIDYGRLRIGDGDFLLPSASEVKMTLTNEEHRNSVRFSSCRRFAGESVLIFTDSQSAETKAAPVKLHEVSLPKDMTLELEFPNELDLTQAAVGDPVQAVLRANAARQKQVLAPKGAVASGRIVKLERHAGFFLLGIEFRDLAWPGAHANLKAVFDRTVGVLPASAGLRSPPIVQGVEGDDLVIFRPGPARLKGIVMNWRTAP
jgi:hypothetical protein